MDATEMLATDEQATLADGLMLLCDSLEGFADAIWTSLSGPGIAWRMVDFKEDTE